VAASDSGRLGYDEADQTTYQQLISETSILPDLLETARARCNIVVVDSPPGLGPITRAVLGASQHVIVPLQCEPLALQNDPADSAGYSGCGFHE
jgi:chromosome partitioning protein